MAARKIDHKTRRLLRLGWITVLLLAAWALFSPWGAIRHYTLTNDLKKLAAANLELKKNNRELQEENSRLTSDPAYIESIARERHGLLKNNEFIYVFPDEKKASH